MAFINKLQHSNKISRANSLVALLPNYISNNLSKLTLKLINPSSLDNVRSSIFNSQKNSGHNNDIWGQSSNWLNIKTALSNNLLNNKYFLSPSKSFLSAGHRLNVWSAQDSIVIKQLNYVLTSELKSNLSWDLCYSFKGNGGLKAAVRDTQL